MENIQTKDPQLPESSGSRSALWRLAIGLITAVVVFGLPFWQPLAAVTISPIVAGIYMFAKFFKLGFLTALCAATSGVLAIPVYAWFMLTYVVPASYFPELLATWSPVLGLMLVGSIISLVIWIRGSSDSLKSHATTIGAVWFLVPALTGTFWAGMYLFVLPFVNHFHSFDSYLRFGTVAGVIASGLGVMFLLPRIYQKFLTFVVTAMAVSGLTFLQGTVWETWFLLALILAGTGVLLAIWHFATRKLSKPVRNDALVWVLTMAIASWFWHVNVDLDIVEWQTAKSLEPEIIKQLPDSAARSSMRMLARSTAHTYITNNTNPQIPLRASHPHLIMGADRLYWQSHFHIDTVIGQFCDSVRLVVRMDADETTQSAETFDKPDFPYALFPCSSESWVFQGAFKARHPFSVQGNHIYWLNDDKTWSALIPYTSLRPTSWGTMVPYVSGVMEVTQFGLIKEHSIEDAASKFRGAVFFPSELARQLVEKYVKWHGGFVGRGFTQTGELAISEEDENDLGTSSTGNKAGSNNPLMKNQFPYLQKFEGLPNLQEVFQLEPAAKDNFGLVEVLFFDSITGKVRVWQNTESLTGPARAGLQVRNADPDMGNWEDTARVEPKLIVKAGRGIYHFYTVVTHGASGYKDGSYVTSVLVNAKNGAAWRIQTAEQLERFLSLKQDPPADQWLYTVVRPAAEKTHEQLVPAQAPAQVPSNNQAPATEPK